MKKKVVSMLLVASMAASLFAGCGGGSNEPAADDSAADAAADDAADDTADDAAADDAADDTADDTADDAAADDASGDAVTLKWAIWDKDTTPYWDALKEGYEAANPGVTVEMTDLGSTDYSTVLATELSGSGSEFDVVTIKDVPGYATLVSKNTLEQIGRAHV